jgi:hypothetical protein
MSNDDDKARVATFAEIKANLLEARNHPYFNIGAPQAIDHLLISILALIDAIEATNSERIRAARAINGDD